MIDAVGSSSPAPKPFVAAERVHKTFGNQTVLDHVSLEIFHGELIAILGPSGCGKTTLLRIIAGLERQNSGRVLIDHRDVSAAPPAARRCGIVFQSYALFPNLSAGQNIAFGMDRRRTTGAQRKRRVSELLELIGLPDINSRRPAQLSGGSSSVSRSPGRWRWTLRFFCWTNRCRRWTQKSAPGFVWRFARFSSG